MPLRLDVKRKLLARSDRVKCVDLHPNEPWTLVSLYNGHVHIWNHESQQLVKSFEVCDLPVRCAKFIVRKNWIATGSDDMQLRIFNYNTLERVHQMEAHSDYLRSIAVHPTQPFLLTSSDDMLVKLWDWEDKWKLKQTFEGHTHYVMQLVINPKDNNTFATASLDKTIKVWQFGSSVPNFTLEGHEKGVNCVDYYHGGDKPYLISGADDRQIKIWDYQNKTCVATLGGHSHNVSAVCFHPELPIIITGSEDSTVHIWHANTNRLETTLNYGLERVWCITAQRGSNTVAIGYDEGSVTIKLGREEPAVSMDATGKVLWAKHTDVQQANLRTIDDQALEAAQDGERLGLSVKDMGSTEVYPQKVQHSPNGRFVVVCGDGEYIIYTATALRNKSFGSGLDFAWANDSNVYAVQESSQLIKLFKSFKEVLQLRPDISLEGIDGGHLLAARSAGSLLFYDWDTGHVVRRIEIAAKRVFWSENGDMVAIAGEDSLYILKYNAEAVANANVHDIGPDGIEDAFEVVGELNEAVKTGFWIGYCFIFTTTLNRLSYYVGGEVVTIAHMDRPLYLLGYLAKENRLFASDKDHNIVSYRLLLPVLEYQTAVMRRDFDAADRILKTIPESQCTRVAQFLEKQGFKKQALAVSKDPQHRFELALSLGDLGAAYEMAQQADSEEKWKQLAHAAQIKSELRLAGECLAKARDFGGLLMLASCAGSNRLMTQLATESYNHGQHNVSFLSAFLLGDLQKCLDILVETGRIPEAAFFAHTYAPSQVPRLVSLWRDAASQSLSGISKRNVGESLADPVKYENLFPGFADALKAEQERDGGIVDVDDPRQHEQQMNGTSAAAAGGGNLRASLSESAQPAATGFHNAEHMGKGNADEEDDDEGSIAAIGATASSELSGTAVGSLGARMANVLISGLGGQQQQQPPSTAATGSSDESATAAAASKHPSSLLMTSSGGTSSAGGTAARSTAISSSSATSSANPPTSATDNTTSSKSGTTHPSSTSITGKSASPGVTNPPPDEEEEGDDDDDDEFSDADLGEDFGDIGSSTTAAAVPTAGAGGEEEDEEEEEEEEELEAKLD